MKKGIMVIAALAIILTISCTAIVKVSAFTYSLTQTSLSIYGQPWVFQIASDDPAVTHVTVIWLYSTPPPLAVLGTTFQTDQFSVSAPFSFSDQIIPTNIGTHWAIEAEFKNAAGTIIHTETHEEEFAPPNRVPEVPLLGTIGAAIAMIFATGFYFKYKRPNLQKI